MRETEENPYETEFADETPWRSEKPSPFSTWPARRWLRPALLFSGVAALVSLVFWNHSLPFEASGASVLTHREYWRLVTALFAHGDVAHLASNLMPLLFFGWMLRSYFGAAAFPWIPLLVGVASNLVTVSLYRPAVGLVGASGMIYGMMALWLVLYLRFETTRSLAKRVVRAVGFVLILILPQQYDPQVSYLAHASGFSIGLASGVIGLPFFHLREAS